MLLTVIQAKLGTSALKGLSESLRRRTKVNTMEPEHKRDLILDLFDEYDKSYLSFLTSYQLGEVQRFLTDALDYWTTRQLLEIEEDKR